MNVTSGDRSRFGIATTLAIAASAVLFTSSAAAGDSGIPLDGLVSQPDIAGYVGPIELTDGVQVAVITRTGDVFEGTGTVELAVQAADGWHIEQVIEAGFPGAPTAPGDLDADGVSEVVVSMIAPTAGKTWDVIYRIDPAGPTIAEIPFAFDELSTDVSPTGLIIDLVTADRVDTTILTCTPSCGEDLGTALAWELDRSGDLTLRPMPQPANSDPAVDVSQLTVPGPIDFASQLLWGYEYNLQGVTEYGDPGQVAADALVLSGLTGWRWTDEMVIALGASYCNDWPEDVGDDGFGQVSEIGYETWATAIGPVLGIDAEAARTALDARSTGSVHLPQYVCG